MESLILGSIELRATARLGSAPAGYLLNGDSQEMLVAIYLVILGSALMAAIWWALRARRDPLAGAPLRRNTLQPESVILAALAYLGTAALLYALMGTDGLEGVEGGAEESVPLTPAQLFRGVVVTNGSALLATAVCLLLAARQFEGGMRGFLFGRARPGVVLLWTVGLTVVACAVCQAVLFVTVILFRWAAPEYELAEHSVIEILQDGSLGRTVLVLSWLGAAVIAPVAEEVFFRGFLQTFLVGWLRSRWLAILLAALAFTLVHAQVHALPALLLFGVLLGVAYERTGSLLVPILVHALFNLKTLIGVMWLSGGSQ